MNRILIPLAGLAVGNAHAYSVGGATFGEHEIDQYRKHHCKFAPMICVLAVSSNGAYGVGVEHHLEKAKSEALAKCKGIANKPNTCEVVDVGGTSDFIKSDEAHQSPLNKTAENAPSLKDKLLELRALVEEGLLTEQDYEAAKKQLLENM